MLVPFEEYQLQEYEVFLRPLFPRINYFVLIALLLVVFNLDMHAADLSQFLNL